MSVPFSDPRFGACFQEAIIILESLEAHSYKDEAKEKKRVSTASYIRKKLWHCYPYDCEDYFNRNPGHGDGKGAVRPKES